jgi:hypothetical protein
MARLPSRPKGLGSAIGKRLRSIRYTLADVFFVLGRVPRAIGRGLRAFWGALTVKTRQRFLLALLGGIAVALFIFLAVPALPCQVPGGERCPPDDDAADIVPADSLAYAHVNVDPDTDQYEDAAELAQRVPRLTQQITGRMLSQLPGPRGAPPKFDEDIDPWFGGEAAIVVIPKGRDAEQVQLLETTDTDGALKYAEEISSGAPAEEEYRGVTIRVDDRGLATALVGDFLAIATSEGGLRRVIDVDTAAEGARSLASEPIAEEVRDRLPGHRIAEVYLSADGVADYVADSGASLSTLEPFVNARATGGTALALSAGSGDLELAIRSALEAERAKAQPGFFGAFPEFEPELTGKLGEDTLGYLGIGDPERALEQLLTQASADAPGLAEGFANLSDEIDDLGKVDLEKDLLPSLGGETAFSLQPGPARGRGDEPEAESDPVPGIDAGPAPSPAVPVPFLSAIADDVDEKETKDALARLQGPIAEQLADSDVQAPVFNREEIEGVPAQSLRVSPTVNLTYAIVDSLLVVATDPQGVAEVAGGEGGLDESERFEAATKDFDEEDPSALLYFNLAELIVLGEREGLGDIAGYREFADEWRRVLALGLAVRSSQTGLDTDARITVAPVPEEEDEEDAPEAPEPIAPASD